MASDDVALHFNGIDAATGSYLLGPRDTAALADVVRGKPAADRGHQAELEARARIEGPHLGVKQGIDPTRLEEAGWGVIFAAVEVGSDHAAHQAAIAEALSPLLSMRKRQATAKDERFYKEYRGPLGYRPGESKLEYLARLGAGPGPADPVKVPYFLLIVASPQEIPFEVQYQIDVQYAVGRLHFETVQEYADYARSVVASETGPQQAARTLTMLGVANPDDPATQLSRAHLVEPLATTLDGWNGWTVDRCVDQGAHKAAVLERMGGARTPSLLFSGSHGMAFAKGEPKQRRHQGALLLQDWAGPERGKGPIGEELYLSCDDIGADAQLSGLIAFNFACYSGGTPQYDDFSKQAFKERTAIAEAPFVSGLHQRLLGHPNGGALACIGHIERAWGTSFMWKTGRRRTAQAQLGVFQSALEVLMQGKPVGVAMEYFNQRYSELASDLAQLLERLEWESVDDYALASAWTSSNDARDYAVLGDPAVRLPLPGGGTAGDEERAREVVEVASAIPASSTPVSFGVGATEARPSRAVPASTPPGPSRPYFTLNISLYRVAETYQVELAHRDPNSDAQMASLRGPAAIDTERLLRLQGNHEDYGKALVEQLLSDDAIRTRFGEVQTAAQVSDGVLRMMLSIDPSAQELHALRWELLRHPVTDAVLGTMETLLPSRLMVSNDWRPVKLRARAELTALVAVSAPEPRTLERMGLAPVDFARELAGVRGALGGIEVRTIGGPGSPLTLDRLADELRRGVDVLYLVAHGMFGRRTNTPALVLQNDDGQAAVTEGEALAARVAELQHAPRVVVLASCQSAGDGKQVAPSAGADPGTALRTTVQATLAGRLADAGVPAIVAMQGFITMKSVEVMMPVFFAELLADGQIDRALAVARGKIRDRDDWWMPALYTRLTGGRLWYTPGFHGKGDGQEVWTRLLRPVADGKVVPIIGPRLLEGAFGASHETARRLAEHYHYPMAAHEWDDLPRVTEFMSVKESRQNVFRAYQQQLLHDLIAQHRGWLPPEAIRKPKLSKLLALVAEHLRNDESDAYRILSELRASVYVTTNFDPLLEWALKAQDREPQDVLTRWRYQRAPQSADEQVIAEPTVKAPLVYHVFGAFKDRTNDGLVLTQDDHFDYLIGTAAGQLTPAEVESALVDNSLLFLGFRLTDWHFRVLFRLMMSLPGRERLKQYCHVAVQLDPDMQSMADVEGAKKYLTKYFGEEANIDIFWGSSEDFLVALRDELAAAGDLSVDEEPPEDEDEWDF